MRWLSLLLLPCLALPARAETPALIQYQGVVLTASGAPRAGAVDLELRIFDAATEGSELFAETHPAVALVDGVFAIAIGSVQPLDPALFAGPGPRWLEVAVDGEPLGPRQQFLATPYCFEASSLGGQTASQIQAAPGPVAGFEQVSAGSFASGVTATCPPGKVAVGGGCDCIANTLESRPIAGTNSWRCECSSSGATNNRAWALCADSGPVCGNGAVDPGEECDSTGAGCPGSVGAGGCTTSCACTCGNGVCEDGVEAVANCPADCRPAYSRCTSDAQCEGSLFCLQAVAFGTAFCTSSCPGATCNLDGSFAERCNAGGPQTTYCTADCNPPPITGIIWRCPNDLQCQNPLSGGFFCY